MLLSNNVFSADYDVQLDSDEEPLSLLERRKAELKAESEAPSMRVKVELMIKITEQYCDIMTQINITSVRASG